MHIRFEIAFETKSFHRRKKTFFYSLILLIEKGKTGSTMPGLKLTDSHLGLSRRERRRIQKRNAITPRRLERLKRKETSFRIKIQIVAQREKELQFEEYDRIAVMETLDQIPTSEKQDDPGFFSGLYQQVSSWLSFDEDDEIDNKETKEYSSSIKRSDTMDTVESTGSWNSVLSHYMDF